MATLPELYRISDYAVFWAERTPEAVAFTCDGVDLTYRDLLLQMQGRAGWLLDRGVQRGDRVALLSPPSTEALVVYLAAASIGAVFQGLNPAHTAAELAYVLGDSQPRVVLDATSSAVLRAASAVPPVPLATVAGHPQQALTLGRAQQAVGPRDAALLVYTSGSTGRPKGALLPHGALGQAAAVHARRWYGSSPLVTVCPFPINHVASLSDICGTTLAAGGRCVLVSDFDPDEMVELLGKERVTLWGFIPAAANLMVRSRAWESADLSSVEHAVWGGGTISTALVHELRARGLEPTGCYGSTETVANVCFTGPGEALVPAALGRPDNAFDVRLDPSTGELLVRSEHPFLGYLNQAEATAAAFDGDGFLRTGDVAVEGPDGVLSLIGRTHEMFKSGGYNVYPREVELALEQLPDVQLAAVVSVADPVFGEVGHAYVVAPGAQGQDLQAAVRDLLASYKVPKQVHVVDDLPLLAVGKVDKVALTALSVVA